MVVSEHPGIPLPYLAQALLRKGLTEVRNQLHRSAQQGAEAMGSAKTLNLLRGALPADHPLVREQEYQLVAGEGRRLVALAYPDLETSSALPEDQENLPPLG